MEFLKSFEKEINPMHVFNYCLKKSVILVEMKGISN